ncbi:hypothetical protein E1265_27155 [Streptomyces sp. 8K308]|nr:hypothetical protein E1265_27155 [Streptomyces sp. 8K308]
MPSTPRSLPQRRAAALQRLDTNVHLWLSTASDGHGAHLIPVAYVWDGGRLTMATFVQSRTMANLKANPHARVAIGTTSDVVMIDGLVEFVEVADIDTDSAERFARVSHDPRAMPGFRYLRMAPTRIQVWNGFNEYAGRTVMANGTWLDKPID